MVTLDLNQQASNSVELHFLRGKAIQAYASIEFNLSILFAGLLQTSIDYAGIIFFRLTNTHSRNAIFEALLKKRYSNQFEAYWHGIPNSPNRQGLFSLIRQLDQRRNEIVHWHTVNHINLEDDGKQSSYLDLSPPNAWAFKTDRPKISTTELKEFCAKADFVARSIGCFFAVTGETIPAGSDSAETWNEIFQQPCIYPPPDNHPLSLNYKAPETPHPPSQR